MKDSTFKILVFLAASLFLMCTQSCQKETINPTQNVRLDIKTFDGDWTLITIDGSTPVQNSVEYNIFDNKLTNNGATSEITWTTSSTALLNNTNAYGFYLSNDGNTLTMSGESELVFNK